jgi:glycosyltransferase involved in cell wall biosynthesis
MLVPPNDPDALAHAVGRLLSDRTLAMRLGASARASVEATASVEGYAARLLELCELALERP